MKISTRMPSVKTQTWYLTFEDAPEIHFRDGEMYSPTEVTVSSLQMPDRPVRFYMDFVSPKSRKMGMYSSYEDAVNRIDSLPAELLAAIYKECR